VEVRGVSHKRQKETSRARLTLDREGPLKLNRGQFTLFDFVDRAFPFSHAKKQNTLLVLEELKRGPKTFKELQTKLDLQKSALYYLLVALAQAGLVSKKEGKNGRYSLSPVFSSDLESLAGWWRGWLQLD